VRELFDSDVDIALFYFAGHGYIEDTGGSCARATANGRRRLIVVRGDDDRKQLSGANKVIILDSCHSGIAGNRADNRATAEIKEGTTLLTASTAEQYAVEDPDRGCGRIYGPAS